MEKLYRNILSQTLHQPIVIDSFRPIGGGCINNAVTVSTDQGNFFVKTNGNVPADFFEKEMLGVQILNETQLIRLPEIYGFGQTDGLHYLVMEEVSKGPPSPEFWQNFGESMARLHHQSASTFGLDHHNYIGSLPQSNTMYIDWCDFFVSQRLEPLLALASEKSLIAPDVKKDFEGLFPRLPTLFPDEKPGLIHGDLWSGNFMIDSHGHPVLIDPAVYYGHREIEISFTHMFGGFDPQFYRAYQEEYPLEQGFQDRIALYNLYPLLVHVNLFGSSYLPGIRATLKKYR